MEGTTTEDEVASAGEPSVLDAGPVLSGGGAVGRLLLAPVALGLKVP